MYGSRVYGTYTDASDYDFVVVADGCESGVEFRNGDLNVQVYNTEKFKDLLRRHNITSLECLFLPQEYILYRSYTFDFKLNLPALRHSVSAKASNSWVKCKKKLTVEEGCEYIGKKSLFHALRIVLFGTQIAQHGCILDYGAANPYYYEIMSMTSNSWEDYKKKYHPVFNKLMTEFRALAPKK